jgi:hypothetical protein
MTGQIARHDGAREVVVSEVGEEVALSQIVAPEEAPAMKTPALNATRLTPAILW